MPLQSTCWSAFRRSDYVELSHEDPASRSSCYSTRRSFKFETYAPDAPDLLKFLRCVLRGPRKYKNPHFDTSTSAHLLDYNHATLVYFQDAYVLCRYRCCISLTRLGDETNFFG